MSPRDRSGAAKLNRRVVGGNTSGRYGPGRNEFSQVLPQTVLGYRRIKLPNGGDETLKLSLCRCHSGCGSVALGCGFVAIVDVPSSFGILCCRQIAPL